MFNFTKLCLSMILLWAWSTGYGQDADVPQINAISFSSQMVDAATGDVTVSMFIEVTDNLSGVKNVLPDLIYPNGRRESCVATLISGDEMNGTWRYDFTVPQYMEAGLATMDVYLTDNALNHTFLTAAQIKESGRDSDFEIVNDNPDTAAPVITGITISDQVVDVANGDAMVTISIDVQDNLSGTAVILPNLLLPNGMEFNGSAQLVSGNSINGRWEKTFTIPQYTQVGMALFGLFLEDKVYNGVSVTSTGISNSGFDNDFEIIGGIADNTPPQITSFSVSTEAVYTNNGDAVVSVLIGTTDDLSGVYSVIPHLTTPNGVISSDGAVLVSGDENDGLWRYDFIVPQYSSDGIGELDVTIKDEVNNCQVLSFQDLDDMGFVASFLINPAEDNLPIQLVNFSAKNVAADVLLTWKVTSATSDFICSVEHSLDGVSFKKIGMVTGGITSPHLQHFEFLDKNPVEGRHYYRLQQIETTGAKTYSPLVNILVEKATTTFFPNPTTGILNIDTISEWVQVTNLQGQVLLQLYQNSAQIDLSILPKGIYLVKTQINGVEQVKQVVKR